MAIETTFDPEAICYEPWRVHDPDDDEDDEPARQIREEVGRRLEADPGFAGLRWQLSVYRAGEGEYHVYVDCGYQPRPRAFPADSPLGLVADRVVELMRYARDFRRDRTPAGGPFAEFAYWT